MKKILAALPNYSKYCGEAKQYLMDRGYEVIENTTGGPLSEVCLIDLVQDADAAICGAEIWSKKAVNSAGKLKVMARFGVGVDNFPLEVCRERGIICTNCPGLNSNSVAEHTVMLMLNILRECPQLNQDIREGTWRRVMVTELKGKTVGLLGFGAVAKRVAWLLQGFGCIVLAYDKFPDEEAAVQIGVTLCPLEKLFKSSDIISVHVPALKDTYHMINQESIALCKDGVYLVNTSRGSNVDEEAVYYALKSGKIAGFGADVFELEPVRKDYKLFELKNYICTPHTAAESYENYRETGIKTAQAVIDVLENHREPWHRVV